MHSKTRHHIRIDKVVDHKELDSHYYNAHSGHDHAPMQPHEVDHHDHHMRGTPANAHVPNPAADLTARDEMPYQNPTSEDGE